MLRNFFLSFLIFSIPIAVPAQKSLYFEGANAVSSDALLSIYKACTTKTLDPDARNAVRFRAFCLLENVREYFWSQGYLNAKVEMPEKLDDGRFMVIVDEGVRYRLGDVTISGSTAFSAKQLRKELDLKTGEIADRKKISDFATGKINELYNQVGFIQFIADVQPKFRNDPNSATEGIADISITIDEGRQFAVRRITVVGNLYIKDRVVMDAMLTKPGDIFDRKKFDESIKQLNQLGLFEVIRDDNFELNVDTETGDVDIVVKVVERRRH